MKKTFFAIVASLAIIALLANTGMAADQQLTYRQKKALTLAFDYGSRVTYEGKKQGTKTAEIVAGIIFQESRGNSEEFVRHGVIIGDGGDSYGPMQVQPGTAREIFEDHPYLLKKYFKKTRVSDAELKYALLHNLEFNIEMGSKYYEMMLKRFHGNHDRAILAYNRGPYKTSDPNHYIWNVKNNIAKVVRPHISTTGLYAVVARIK